MRNLRSLRNDLDAWLRRHPLYIECYAALVGACFGVCCGAAFGVVYSDVGLGVVAAVSFGVCAAVAGFMVSQLALFAAFLIFAIIAPTRPVFSIGALGLGIVGAGVQSLRLGYSIGEGVVCAVVYWLLAICLLGLIQSIRLRRAP